MSTTGRRTHYQPPWGNANIIGVAGSSGSGKTSLAMAIVASMNLPWVVILSMVRQRACAGSRAHILRMLGLVLQAADSRGISQGFQE
jgi:ABC-type dipeptide/oligopeptide/nickel transport system ATPase subunit